MAVRESVHRIERAIVNLGYQRHPGRTIINLAPADLRKDAGGFDLPCAIGLLIATGQLLPEQVKDYALVGELTLVGAVRPIKGVLSMAMCAAEQGIPKMIVPQENAREAAVVQEIDVLGVSNLSEAVGILSGKLDVQPVRTGIDELFAKLSAYPHNFNDVRGQETAKRALTVAASDGHNVLTLPN